MVRSSSFFRILFGGGNVTGDSIPAADINMGLWGTETHTPAIMSHSGVGWGGGVVGEVGARGFFMVALFARLKLTWDCVLPRFCAFGSSHFAGLLAPVSVVSENNISDVLIYYLHFLRFLLLRRGVNF